MTDVFSRGNRDPGRRLHRRKLWAGAAAAVSLLAGLCAFWLQSVGAIPELFAGSPPSAAAPGSAVDAGTDGSSRGEGTVGTAAPGDSVIPRELRDRLE